jgi:hypothetical protein
MNNSSKTGSKTKLWDRHAAAILMLIATALAARPGSAAQFDVPAPAIGDGYADLVFNPTTGVLSLHTDGSTISSLVIRGPQPTMLLNGGGLWPTVNGGLNQTVTAAAPPRTLSWDAIHFNGSQQWILLADSANMGITSGGSIARYAPGAFDLSSSMLGDVEYTTYNTNGPSDLVRTRLAIGTLPLSGDYNGNGRVDAADYVVWRKTLGQMVTIGTGADGSANGLVDPADYSIWRKNFGIASPITGTSSVAAIPEPGSMRLCLAVVVCGISMLGTRSPRSR